MPVVDVRWWCGFVPVMDVGLCRWWVWDVGLFGLVSLVLFFFLRWRWWPSVFVPVVAVGDDDEDSDRDRENIIYYFNV